MRGFTCTCMLLVSVLSVCSERSSTASSWVVVSGSVMKPGLSCRIHFLYTLITFLVADASQDGSRKALGGRTLAFNLNYYTIMNGFWKGSLVIGYVNKRPAEGSIAHVITVSPSSLHSNHDPEWKLYNTCTVIHFTTTSNKKKYCLVTPLYLVEDLVDKIHIVSGGQQDGMHHVVDIAVLLLNATQTGIAVPSIWQRAAVGVALLRLPRWPVRIPIWCLILLLLLAATACSDSLATTGTRWKMRVP